MRSYKIQDIRLTVVLGVDSGQVWMLHFGTGIHAGRLSRKMVMDGNVRGGGWGL